MDESNSLKSFTVKTEKGEVRRMTPEEVNAFVRQKIERVTKTSSPHLASNTRKAIALSPLQNSEQKSQQRPPQNASMRQSEEHSPHQSPRESPQESPRQSPTQLHLKSSPESLSPDQTNDGRDTEHGTREGPPLEKEHTDKAKHPTVELEDTLVSKAKIGREEVKEKLVTASLSDNTVKGGGIQEMAKSEAVDKTSTIGKQKRTKPDTDRVKAKGSGKKMYKSDTESVIARAKGRRKQKASSKSDTESTPVKTKGKHTRGRGVGRKKVKSETGSVEDNEKVVGKQKMSNAEIDKLIKHSIHRARQARKAAAVTTPNQKKKNDHIQADYDSDSQFDEKIIGGSTISDPVGAANRRFSWSSVDDSSSIEDTDTESGGHEKSTAEMGRSAQSAFSKKDSNVFHPQPEGNTNIVASIPATKVENNVGNRDTTGLDRKDEPLDEHVVTSNRVLTQEEIRDIVQVSMERAQQSARDQIKVMLLESQEHDANSPLRDRVPRHQEVATIAREKMHLARESAQDEIRSLVREYFRSAPESAQEEIRQIVRESMQRARASAKEEMSELVRSILRQEHSNSKRAASKSSNSDQASAAKAVGAPLRGVLLSRSTSSDIKESLTSGRISMASRGSSAPPTEEAQQQDNVSSGVDTSTTNSFSFYKSESSILSGKSQVEMESSPGADNISRENKMQESEESAPFDEAEEPATYEKSETVTELNETHFESEASSCVDHGETQQLSSTSPDPQQAHPAATNDDKALDMDMGRSSDEQDTQEQKENRESFPISESESAAQAMSDHMNTFVASDQDENEEGFLQVEVEVENEEVLETFPSREAPRLSSCDTSEKDGSLSEQDSKMMTERDSLEDASSPQSKTTSPRTRYLSGMRPMSSMTPSGSTSTQASSTQSATRRRGDHGESETVVTDEFLALIASKKGSKITAQELNELMNQPPQSPNSPRRRRRRRYLRPETPVTLVVSSGSFEDPFEEPQQQSRFCMNFLDFWSGLDDFLEAPGDEEDTFRSQMVSSRGTSFATEDYDVEAATDTEDSRAHPNNRISFSFSPRDDVSSYDEEEEEDSDRWWG